MTDQGIATPRPVLVAAQPLPPEVEATTGLARKRDAPRRSGSSSS